MKRILAVAVASILVFAISNVYACEEKQTDTKASKPSMNSTEKSGMAEVIAADSKSEKAEMMKADYMKTGMGDCCPGSSRANAAGVKKADAKSGADKTYCPATKESSEPSVKDAKAGNSKTAKAEEKDWPRVSTAVSSSAFHVE